MKKEKNSSFLIRMTDQTEDFFIKILKIIGLKKFVSWYLKHQEVMRYLIFGGISTVINILVFMILKNLGISTFISNSLAWVISIVFAYFTNKLCVFYSETNKKNDLMKEIISFLGYRIFTLIIDEIFVIVTIDILNLNSLLMKIISNIIVIILNYVFSKFIIFSKKS